jgi:hypothetical protein
MKGNIDEDLARDLLVDDEGNILNGRVVRWLPTVVVVSALAGFVGLAWYAYNTGAQSMQEDQLLVVEADKAPMKEKPLDPGGMKFPNQDKTIFDTFAGSAPPPRVERVLPAPEEPMPRDMDTSGTKTWINDKLQKEAPPPAAQEQVIGEKKPEEATAPSDQQSPVVSYSKPAEAVPPPPAAESKPAESKPVEAAPAPQEKLAKIADTSVKVQLGAYRSEKEAKAAWQKMQQTHKALFERTPIIVKADLGAKGIYYRLRTGGFASTAEAKAFCGQLTGQACIPASGN